MSPALLAGGASLICLCCLLALAWLEEDLASLRWMVRVAVGGVLVALLLAGLLNWPAASAPLLRCDGCAVMPTTEPCGAGLRESVCP